MANSTEITLHELGEETAAGDGDAVDMGETRSGVKVRLRVTAVDGTATPTLTATLQTSTDGASGWRTALTATAQAAVGKVDLIAVDLDRYVRLSWTIAGTDPEFTFSAEGTAHTVFATREDIVRGDLKESSLTNVPDDTLAEALINASCDAEDAIAASNALPLTSWPESLSRRVSTLAAYQIMTTEGFRPTGFDELFVKKFDDAWTWLKAVGAGKIRPPGLAPATELGPKTSSGDPLDATKALPRFSNNWGDFG